MKKRIHLRKKKAHFKMRKRHLFLFTMIGVVITVIFSLYHINRHFTPLLFEMAELEIQKFSTIMVNKAIAQVLEDKINTDELFETVKSEDGSIQTIDFNPVVVNQVLNLATTVVQNNLKLLEHGELDAIGIYDMDLPEERIEDLERGIIERIPMGVLTKNAILANFGPEIPIRLRYVGDVNSNVTTKITPYGINNAMVEVGVHLEMTAQIILPFVTEKMVLECDIPLAIKMVQGSVPTYYGNGFIKDSSMYSLPLE
ncbi:MAG TPA: sporulation protein YunB [Candidatus Scybalousia intestinigallinarum]|nr:sporulation protein YunB [Candidatus Scybalousia intestinigallinarum]